MSAIAILEFFECAQQPDSLVRANPLDPSNTLEYQFVREGLVYNGSGIQSMCTTDNGICFATNNGFFTKTAPVSGNSAFSNIPIPWVSSIASKGNLVYLLGWGKFYIVDIGHTPPAVLDSCICNAWNLAICGKIVFAVGFDVTAYDVSSGDSSKQIWHWVPPREGNSPCVATVKGDTLYVSNGGTLGNDGTHIYIFKIMPPAMNLIGGLDVSAGMSNMTIKDTTLYVTLWNNELLAVNVADPGWPVTLGRILLPGLGTNVQLSGRTAFVSYFIQKELALGNYVDIGGGVVAVDIGDPPHMKIQCDFKSDSIPVAIGVIDSSVFVAYSDTGIVALKFGPYGK